jgi:uncharacterized membrane protein
MDESSRGRSESAGEGGRFEDYPLTREEYFNVMVHFYRGEVQRSTTWRQRLDTTTNWAALTMAAMLSFTFSSKDQEHVILLLSSFIILVYLVIEARRYRYFEVYRARVRMLEENLLLPVITRDLESPMGSWHRMVAMDLDAPKFKTGMLEAIGFRLRRNYLWIFLIILGGWFAKVLVHPKHVESWTDFWDHVAVGACPAWVVIGSGLVLYLGLAVLTWKGRHIHAGMATDEVTGVELDLAHWKL